jgi:hypothetical protein
MDIHSMADENPGLMVKNPNLESEIRSLVDSFVSEISARVRQAALDSLRQAIEGNAPAARRGRPARAAAPAAAGTPGRRGRKPSAASVQAAADLQAHVSANPGQRLEEIGAALGQDTKGLKGPASRLVRDGILRTEGRRRGTRYFPGSGQAKRGAKARRKGRKGRR